MTREHPRWKEFCATLGGPGYCDFTEDGKWKCDSTTNRQFARKALAGMGFDEAGIEASLAYFETNGGYCDCEILFNVDR